MPGSQDLLEERGQALIVKRREAAEKKVKDDLDRGSAAAVTITVSREGNPLPLVPLILSLD